MLPLDAQIVRIDTGRQLDFLHQIDRLVFLAVAFLLGQFVFELSVVDNAANRRNGGRGYFDQIDSALSGQVDGGGKIHDPHLLPIDADDANLACSDLSVDPVLRLTRLRA
jgi:hypothetical protein